MTATIAARLAAEEQLLRGSSHSGLYRDRVRAPADTVASMRGAFSELGITRIARVTNLDRIGIPVFLAVRPNAKTLAVTQGKGIDDNSARASAIMEAAEQAIAEQPRVVPRIASMAELNANGESYVLPDRFLRRAQTAPVAHAPLAWMEGADLLNSQVTWAPYDAVRLDFTEPEPVGHPFWQSTDGLAAGNILLEAVLHGLCERIERDASALWAFRSTDDVQAHCVDPAAFDDRVLSDLVGCIEQAGLRIRLFDITSDIGVPTYFSIIVEPHPTGRGWRHFDLSRGTGCHPFDVRAAIRAVTEAAQSRVTAISATRDDFSPSLYDAPLEPDLHVFRLAEPKAIEPRARAGSDGLLGPLLDRLRVRGVRSVVVVPMGGEELGFSTAKVIVPDLEDPQENKHRRLGRRAVNTMLAAV